LSPLLLFQIAGCSRGSNDGDTLRPRDSVDTGSPLDGDGDGWSVEAGDCDDEDPARHPGAVEITGDGIDQNCDGTEVAEYALIEDVGTLVLEPPAPSWLAAGTAVAFLPDVTGDSLPDIIVGAPGEALHGLYAMVEARAFILASPFFESGSIIATFAEIRSKEFMDSGGSVVGSLGDLDGDESAEIVFGAPWGIENPDGDLYVFATPLAGKVWTDEAEAHLIGEDFARPGFSVCRLDGSEWAYTAFSGTTLDVIVRSGFPTTTNPWEGAGAVLTTGQSEPHSSLAASDLDGDGVSDLIIGTPLYGTHDNAYGAVHLVSGPFADSAVVTDVGASWSGSAAYVHQHAGEAVDAAGDVDGDGLGDVVVGAFFRSLHATADGGAFLIRGRHDLSGSHELEDADLRIDSENPYDSLADEVTGLGDVDGDGGSDVAIAATRSFNSNPPAPRIYILRSPPPSGVVSAGELDAVLIGTAGQVAAGVPYSVTNLLDGGSDTNLDGVPELLIGSPEADNDNGDEPGQGTGQGVVHLLNGIEF
jgi:hypothetical protein